MELGRPDVAITASDRSAERARAREMDGVESELMLLGERATVRGCQGESV